MRKILIFLFFGITMIMTAFVPTHIAEAYEPPAFKEAKDDYKKIITTDPLWYLHPQLKPVINAYFTEDETKKSKQWVADKRAFIQMVGSLLEQGKVKLGKPIEDFDEGRQTISTVVIHHTETSPKAPLSYIQGIHLFNLYVLPVFSDPENSNYAKPVFSGHYDGKNRQVFYAYHYIVKPDGTYTQTLKDEYIGWHAQSANSYSIGISVVGNYEKSQPPQKVIQAIQKILQKYPTAKVVGHREVVPTTECPGDAFFGPNGWKQEVI